MALSRQSRTLNLKFTHFTYSSQKLIFFTIGVLILGKEIFRIFNSHT